MGKHFPLKKTKPPPIRNVCETDAHQEDKEMANTKKSKAAIEQDVDVLYQRLGDQWFAFSIINDEVFMSPIPEAQIEAIRRDTDYNNDRTSVPSEKF